MDKKEIKDFLERKIDESEKEYLEVRRLVKDREWTSQMARGVILDNIIRRVNTLTFLIAAVEGTVANRYERTGIEQGVAGALNLAVMETEALKGEISNLRGLIKDMPPRAEETLKLINKKKSKEEELEYWDWLKTFLTENKF